MTIPEDGRDVMGSKTTAVTDATRERQIGLEVQSRNYTSMRKATRTLLTPVG